MLKKLLLTFIILLLATPQAYAGAGKKPKPAYWKSNRINLFYQQKEYRGLSDKYKKFTVGVMEIKDERISCFYHKNDNFFQTELLPSLQLMIKDELNNSGMFKEVKLIYEPFVGEITPEKMDRIKKDYDVDMIMLVNLTDFQVIRGISRLFADAVIKGGTPLSPATLDGMDMKFRVGGIFQLVFLPNQYVLWSDKVEREYLQFAPKGTLKSKEEMEPIIQNLISQVMTDMIYLMSEDGKIIKVNY